MLFSAIVVAYAVANAALASIVVVRSPRNILSRFYAFCVGMLLFLGAAAYLWTAMPGAVFRGALGMAINFVYALFPFFFLHFIVLFVRRYEILRSRTVTLMIYTAGLFGYVMILLGRIPVPLSDATGITQSGLVFFLTWLTIFFTIGVAMLYEVARGFSERVVRSNLLMAAFAFLLLLLPGPFTQSVFFGIFHLGSEAYYVSCTIAITIAVYVVFRHKIIVNTHADDLKAALGALSDLFITTDRSFRIEIVRGAAVKSLLGYREQQLVGRPLTELLDDARLPTDHSAEAVTFDCGVRTKNGDLVPMNFSVKPILTEGEIRGYVGLGRDITERRRMEDELRQSQKMESIGTLAAGIAHDINNILQIVLINTLGLRKKDITREQIEKIVRINSLAVDRGAMVVQQILTFAKKAPVSFVLLDLNAAVKDFTAMLEQTFPRTITFRVELDPALPAVMADRGQVHQVLLNLCVNARDAMPAGGTITIRTTVVPEPAAKARFASAHGRYVRLSVADTGTGMDDKTRRHIFDPFFTTKELGKGTGLGLSVVYGIIQAHRGMIDVESVPGEGTEFEVLLPASDERPAPKERSGADGSRPRARGTLLVVEDEVDVRRAVARALEDEGYEVLAAGDGPSAVESLRGRNGTVDLVILDIGLPGMNGWEAFAAMRGVRPDLRAIVASGYLDPATRSTRPADGVVEYLTKPYETEAILGAVRRALSAKSAAGA